MASVSELHSKNSSVSSRHGHFYMNPDIFFCDSSSYEKDEMLVHSLQMAVLADQATRE